MNDRRWSSCGLVVGLAALLGAGGLPAAEAQCLPSPDGLVGWWPGDDADATALEGFGGDPMPEGAQILGTGKVDGAFDFEGTGNYVVVPHDDALNFGAYEVNEVGSGEFTVAAWIKIEPGAIDAVPNNTEGVIAWKEVTSDQGWRFGVVPRREVNNSPPSAEVSFAAKSGGGSRLQVLARIPDGVLDDGQWHYVVARRVMLEGGSANGEIFIDGVPGTPAANPLPAGSLDTEAPIDIGDYSPSLGTHQFNGLIDELSIYNRALTDDEIYDIYLAGADGKCKGLITGTISADCPPGTNTNLLGVNVDVVEVGTATWIGGAVTDANGSYEVPTRPGTYTVSIMTPLGYGYPNEGGNAVPEADESSIVVGPGETKTVDFGLVCIPIAQTQERASFWKRQVGRVLQEKESEYTSLDLCGFLEEIVSHFNENGVNSVDVYTPPSSGDCGASLLVASGLLNLQGSEEPIDGARKELMALLLNVVAGKISLTEIVSDDGVTTLSQAITYCDNLIDEELGDHELARKIAGKINRGLMIPEGWVPPTVENIAYRQPAVVLPAALRVGRAKPNPFNPSTTISFELPDAGSTTVRVFDSHGRLVRSLLDHAWRTAGSHRVRWDGVDDRGAPVGSGVYYMSLTAGGDRATRRVVLTR